MTDWTRTTFHVDDAERTFTVNTFQDVEAIVENNKRLRSIDQKSDWGRHVACVPNNIINKWLQEEWARGNTDLRLFGPGFNEWYERKINDPDNRAWRVDNPSNPFFLGYR